MDNVKKVLEYLRECEVFYMATVAGSEPRVRPMSGVCTVEGKLCFLFSRRSELYHEIMANRRVEISAVHPDKSWISIRGWLKEEESRETKDHMLKACRDDIEDMGIMDQEEMAVFSLQEGCVILRDRNLQKEKKFAMD
ncbi:pyridoxamine 5'-phosphate oxidase family protein [Dialister sp.]|uniref:pyridoxamine 5'-phosphate oxidase family protein n=1 Tax=Dialister sp. TaxID=1955814 RepID=UPI003F0E6453